MILPLVSITYDVRLGLEADGGLTLLNGFLGVFNLYKRATMCEHEKLM